LSVKIELRLSAEIPQELHVRVIPNLAPTVGSLSRLMHYVCVVQAKPSPVAVASLKESPQSTNRSLKK
jgi:hypothetical protein